MKKVSYTFWRDGKHYIGFLNDYPEFQTQAATKSELIENLADLLKDILSVQELRCKAVSCGTLPPKNSDWEQLFSSLKLFEPAFKIARQQ
jgi:hypothetical protein